jgi:hypothetical protein
LGGGDERGGGGIAAREAGTGVGGGGGRGRQIWRERGRTKWAAIASGGL